MPTATFEYSTEAERLSIEHAIAFASEMHQLALDVPHGTVLDACEQQAVERGPAFLRQTLQNALQARMDVADAKKGGPALCVWRLRPPKTAGYKRADHGHRTHRSSPSAWHLC